MERIRVSMLFSAADKYLSQVLLVVTTMVMARLLTPAETGLYVIANSILMLADNLRTFGVGVYVVQTPELHAKTLRSAFTVTMLLSLVLMGGLLLSADAVAIFFGASEIEGLLRLAAFGFLVIPFATPIVALLQRELDFRTLAILNVLAALTSATVTITLGFAGFGPESYVWGFLASGTALAVAAVAVRPQPAMFRPSLAEARQILSFGLVSSSVSLVNMAYESLPRLMLGKLLSFEAVGLFARAVTVCQLPDRSIVSALQPVVLPVLAAQARSGGDLKASYLHGYLLMSAVQWPMLVMLVLLAEPVVLVILGPQWIEAVPLVRMIAAGTMAMAPAFLTFPVLVAHGRIRDTLWSSLISLPPSAMLVFAAGTISIEAVAASMMILAPFQMAVAFWFVRRAINVGWRDMATASRDSLVLAVATAVVPITVIMIGGNGFSLGWGQCLIAIGGGATGWATALRVVGHPVGTEIGALRALLPVRFGRIRKPVGVE
ncbi:lipopolysaccharide biosynthesis protein (plasmid) [Paracoccus liaowanqingii]|uniref:Lipopolysaccharide biosynthesis protein n=1 Tax=Paracoccus liaowanqingii TaxID=2560053 RepID=A0A4Y5SSX1_9RHOB|nr:lipopolysaccharide biosynthesis protein [Paracoccus liaowanqingii]QDA35814.1 lipopolysaccharide biosynthesis protein [Paracoccus liaowanqingii]